MSRPQEIRLSRYLADCGIWSRRKCENLITSGRITVDGCKIIDLSFKVAGSSSVRLNGKPVNPQIKIVLAVNKPPGYISTASDEFGRKTVMDLVKNVEGRLYPAGRLDRDSSGLIILTNDVELVFLASGTGVAVLGHGQAAAQHQGGGCRDPGSYECIHASSLLDE